jgi:putative glycosyltransferase (TIGR04372 family)
MHRIAYNFRRIRQQGIATIVVKIFARSFSLLLGFTLLPLSVALHAIGYRRVTVFADRIGHLALEPDCLLKEQALGIIPKQRWFILAPPGRVANRHLLNLWKPHIHIHEGRITCYILASMSRWGLMRHDISHYILASNSPQAAYGIYAHWGDRPPLLALPPEDIHWGAWALEQLGLPKNAWFVCVHAREGGFSPIDEELHAHRNGSVDATIPAMQEIVRRGGWVVRIGDPSMKPITPVAQVVDYAHHPMKCERLDIVLCAQARFILGNTSGIALVSSAFGVPCALANMIPFSALGLSPRDVSIPKLLWSLKLSRYLTFQEILSSPISNFIYASQYQQSKIQPIENSAEDIRMLALEMLDSLELSGHQSKSASNNLKVCSEFELDNSHYGFGSAAKISQHFIETYRELSNHPSSTPSAKIR